MAKTLAFGRLPGVQGGRGLLIAVGTIASASDAGSFAVQLDTAGSVVMRNVVTAHLTQMGTVAAQITGTGSTNGYVVLGINRLGTFVLATPGGTVDLYFTVYGGGGSI